MTRPPPASATEIAAGVRGGVLSAPDVVAAALARIGERDERLGAFQLVRREKALAEAAAVAGRPDLADLPLAGVPVAIKDNVAVEAEPVRNGSAQTPAPT